VETKANWEYCDLVMKGGITSGVVYPLAINELRTKYLFKNIGGNSAGAIAAALTAAAEYGRRKGLASSYDVLAGLPKELGSDNFLLSLFQPSTATARIFRVALVALKSQSLLGRILSASGSLILNFWAWTLFGVLLGASVPAVLFLIFGGPGVPYVLLGIFWVLVISVGVVLIAAGADALRATVKNRFGFCSGFDPGSTTGPPLTNWLHAKIQAASGKDMDLPLTFGDLWQAPAVDGEPSMTGPTIKLQVVTTNLTLGRPFTIPFESGTFYFSEAEVRSLFPTPVANHLVEKSPKENRTVTTRDKKPLLRLPEAQDFPVVMAARLSLSFPILLSAMPLYMGDFPHKDVSPDGEHVMADRCWFSDGGICSNFPIHFFDSPLPRWPTFGIDLKPARAGTNAGDKDLVWFPQKPGSGSQLAVDNFDQGSTLQRLFGFIGAILNAMQNWRDNIQATAAGYRDRIVHISLRSDEGGLNLNMPPTLIQSLSNRGAIAGRLLRDHFDFGSHIFARYRITMCALQRYLNDLRNAWVQPLPQDDIGRKYVSGELEPAHYRPRSDKLRAVMLAALGQLVELPVGWTEDLKDGQMFCKDNCPSPEPILRNQPKF